MQSRRCIRDLIVAIHDTNGELIAIVPTGSLKSEKDRNAWALLHETFKVSVMETNDHKAFEGCFPQTAIVHISGRNQTVAVARRGREPTEGAPQVMLYRGRLQMHELKNGGTD